MRSSLAVTGPSRVINVHKVGCGIAQSASRSSGWEPKVRLEMKLGSFAGGVAYFAE